MVTKGLAGWRGWKQLSCVCTEAPILICSLLLLAFCWGKKSESTSKNTVSRIDCCGLSCVVLSPPSAFFLLFSCVPWFGGGVYRRGSVGMRSHICMTFAWEESAKGVSLALLGCILHLALTCAMTYHVSRLAGARRTLQSLGTLETSSRIDLYCWTPTRSSRPRYRRICDMAIKERGDLPAYCRRKGVFF